MIAPSLTAALLHAHGLSISPEGLSAAVVDALHRYGSALYPFEDPPGLTEDEVAVLRAGGLEPEAVDRGAADPLVQTIAAHAAILERSMSTAEAARRLGVSEVRIRQRLGEGSLLGIQGSRGWRIPAFQFAARGELPGWARVCRAIPKEANPVAVLRWLDQAQADLDEQSPRQWLAAGRDPEIAAELAAGIVPV